MNLIDRISAEHYAWGEICEGWYLSNAGSLSVVEERIPPGGSEVRHRHQRALQFFFVLQGVLSFEVEVEVEVEGAEYDLSPRQGIEIRPSLPHRVFNRSATDVEFFGDFDAAQP